MQRGDRRHRVVGRLMAEGFAVAIDNQPGSALFILKRMA